jgi:hypothetical protein
LSGRGDFERTVLQGKLNFQGFVDRVGHPGFNFFRRRRDNWHSFGVNRSNLNIRLRRKETTHNPLIKSLIV